MNQSKGLKRKNSLYKSYRLTERHTRLEYCHDATEGKDEENKTITTYVLTQGGMVEIHKERLKFELESLDEYKLTDYVDFVKFLSSPGAEDEVEERWRLEKIWTCGGVEEREILGDKVKGDKKANHEDVQDRNVKDKHITCGLSNLEMSTLEAHNAYRQKHSVPPLSVNPELSRMARGWARKLLRDNVFKHSPVDQRLYQGKPCGENLTRVKAYSPDALTGESATKGWYEEICDYKFDHPGYQKGTGHFSQVVWRDTKEIGVGMISKKEGDVWTIILAAVYFPSGNYDGQLEFEQNVHLPT